MSQAEFQRESHHFWDILKFDILIRCTGGDVE